MKSKTLITCSNGGIASHIAKELVRSGEQIVTTARDGKGDFELDFFCRDSINHCIQDMKNREKKVNKVLLIIPRLAPSSEHFPTPEKWNETFEKYFVNPIFFVEQLITNGIAEKGTSFVFIGGISSKQALTGYAINNTIRLAWIGQVKTMALALAPDYKFNTVSLGGVLTDSYIEKIRAKAESNNLTYDEQLQAETANVPLQKYASTQDVADAVIPLLGSMSNHITGQNIILDGGFIKTYS